MVTVLRSEQIDSSPPCADRMSVSELVERGLEKAIIVLNKRAWRSRCRSCALHHSHFSDNLAAEGPDLWLLNGFADDDGLPRGTGHGPNQSINRISTVRCVGRFRSWMAEDQSAKVHVSCRPVLTLRRERFGFCAELDAWVDAVEN